MALQKALIPPIPTDSCRFLESETGTDSQSVYLGNQESGIGAVHVGMHARVGTQARRSQSVSAIRWSGTRTRGTTPCGVIWWESGPARLADLFARTSAYSLHPATPATRGGTDSAR